MAAQPERRAGYEQLVNGILATCHPDVEVEKEKALTAATAVGNAAIVRALLAAGADLNAKDAGGMSVLDLAYVRGHTEIADILAAAGGERSTNQDSEAPYKAFRESLLNHLEDSEEKRYVERSDIREFHHWATGMCEALGHGAERNQILDESYYPTFRTLFSHFSWIFRGA